MSDNTEETDGNQAEPDLTKIHFFADSCKVCKLSKAVESTPEWQLYNFAIEQAKTGTPAQKISENLTQYTTRMGFNPTIVPSPTSIKNHFDRHVPENAALAVQNARNSYIPQKQISNHSLVDMQIIAQISKDNFDEYDELCQLYSSFKQVCDKVYATEESVKASGTDQWSMSKLQAFTGMVNTQKGILSEISKMRQGEKLIAIASRFILEEFTKNLIVKLKDEFDSFTNIMKRNDVNSGIIEHFVELSTRRIVQLFTEEAGAAIEVTKREFKLPN